MSDPILPFSVWQSGTNSNSVPANDNALRSEILNGLIISDSTDAQPGAPARGDIYIMTGAASGAQWSLFDEFDLAIFDGEGTWHAYAPVEGITVNIAGILSRWDGVEYVEISAVAAPSPVVTESGTSRIATAATKGEYTRFTNAGAKTYDFDGSESYASGDEFHGRNVGLGNLTIRGDSNVTINPPYLGTLVIPQNGTFTVKMISDTEGDLIGVTVPL